MPTKQTQTNTPDFGDLLFQWDAHNYHPYSRGKWWMIIFLVVLLGGSFALFLFGDNSLGTSFWTSGWISNLLMMVTIFLAVGVYLYMHWKKDQEHHTVSIFERAIVVDQDVFPMQDIVGYWMVLEPDVTLLNIERPQTRLQKNRMISLQMGQVEPVVFRKVFTHLDIPELLDRKESNIDQWIRILKL